MKLFIVLIIMLGWVHLIYTQDHATAIVGSVFDAVGGILKTIGAGPQPQASSSKGSLGDIISLVINLFTGLLKGGSKPNIASSIPSFPKDNTPTFPGGEGSFPDFPGAEDFLKD